MSKFHQVCVGAIAFAGATAAHGNLVLNGSFENNSAGGTIYNMSNAQFNSVVADATAFGGAEEIDIMITGDPYGLAPVDGDYKLGIHRSTSGATDAFSFDLSSPIVAGELYHVEFWAHAVTDFDPGTEPVLIGVSTSPTAFGTLVYTSGVLSTNSWTMYASDFVAPSDASYLTVQNATGTPTWAHIDAFSLTLVPAPATWAVPAFGMLTLRRRRR